MRLILPVLTVVAALVALWYIAAVPMNIKGVLVEAERAGAEVTPPGAAERRDMRSFALVAQNGFAIPATWAQERPRLPAPHQVAVELWETTVEKRITSKRSLIYHAWITLSATLLGFAIGSAAGVLLAVGILYNRAMDMSVMPWAIASQTIPILAIAPMIIVVLNSVGVQGLLPKAMISAYLSFFPVVVGMVKGLRSPDAMQLDLLRTYNASPSQGFWLLRLPASMPYFFTSLKIAAAASLVGAIVGELPTGAVAGLGARLLAGSYYGQTIQIWSALFGAAILAAVLVGIIGLIQRITLKRMGLSQ
ncbi:binding-protein-dependent transport systems inner membrane component [Dinoroseobacter shibae DFL 12 = DSM 16493]|jgi:NitT/TauT family transport system permease protein|uniref:Binding-protein-dependent transport systems inner membrane component n=1 Tax=Dinoroseobacter shibae (strain DSM 16493 / NCIMB 14021 / DFL 12) TaxID=398580 RepID=A8LJ92_DINSH|nr:ABC transporter permease [Dinoroseobacter shibae]ABV93114.1 binding-protein-dependent transport systems inner membrane component [Dinoroseobacter shibae DFL 12 = DSM 16493]URF48042.1 ABC transporter permease [Dinoroseobacter shibae]URF52351.1 ABC transporter permease [Dinoroseobacter shibae]